MSAIMPIGLIQNFANASNKGGAKQGSLCTASFKLGPTFSALVSKTT